MAKNAAGAAFGALFDWDGVVVDSKRLHEAAWNQVAAEFGYAHGPADFRRHFGTQNRRAIQEILGWSVDPVQIERISARKEELYRKLASSAADLLVPGVRAFLDELAVRAVPCAVVSSSPLRNIEHVMDGLGLRSRFRSIVTAEDCRHGKPDPEGFLLGAARLGVPPERCVVFEDAPVGILAGRSGGMRVVALATTHPASELSGADRIVAGWTSLTLEDIACWFAPEEPGHGAPRG